MVRALSRAIGAAGPDFEAFMRRRLFEPLGMRSPIPKFDAAGTFIGSSFCFARARDFARFGNGSICAMACGTARACCPRAGWITPARPPFQRPFSDLDGGYGYHWWLDMAGPGSFSANGYDGQFTVCVPELDLVLVRHGVSEANKVAVKAWIADVIDCFLTEEELACQHRPDPPA